MGIGIIRKRAGADPLLRGYTIKRGESFTPTGAGRFNSPATGGMMKRLPSVYMAFRSLRLRGCPCAGFKSSP
jgi:hypothetical protein